MNYYKNRWYDAETGRFMSHDPLGVVPEGYINKFNTYRQYRDGINVYQYVKSQPLSFSDSLGLGSGLNPAGQCAIIIEFTELGMTAEQIAKAVGVSVAVVAACQTKGHDPKPKPKPKPRCKPKTCTPAEHASLEAVKQVACKLAEGGCKSYMSPKELTSKIGAKLICINFRNQVMEKCWKNERGDGLHGNDGHVQQVNQLFEEIRTCLKHLGDRPYEY